MGLESVTICDTLEIHHFTVDGVVHKITRNMFRKTASDITD